VSREEDRGTKKNTDIQAHVDQLLKKPQARTPPYPTNLDGNREGSRSDEKSHGKGWVDVKAKNAIGIRGMEKRVRIPKRTEKLPSTVNSGNGWRLGKKSGNPIWRFRH